MNDIHKSILYRRRERKRTRIFKDDKEWVSWLFRLCRWFKSFMFINTFKGPNDFRTLFKKQKQARCIFNKDNYSELYKWFRRIWRSNIRKERGGNSIKIIKLRLDFKGAINEDDVDLLNDIIEKLIEPRFITLARIRKDQDDIIKLIVFLDSLYEKNLPGLYKNYIERTVLIPLIKIYNIILENQYKDLITLENVEDLKYKPDNTASFEYITRFKPFNIPDHY